MTLLNPEDHCRHKHMKGGASWYPPGGGICDLCYIAAGYFDRPVELCSCLKGDEE